MNKPNPTDYGLVQADLDDIVQFHKNSSGIPGLGWLDSILSGMPELVGGLLFWTILWPFFLVALILSPITKLFWPVRHPKHEAFQRYAAVCEEYLRGQRSFWTQLSGVDFETQLAELYRRQGYEVQLTKASGDDGVDLVLRRSGRTGIVQCKQWAQAAGTPILRELLGSLVAYRADYAVLACTGGFTRPAVDFARSHSIQLLTLDDIINTATKGEQCDPLNSLPRHTSCLSLRSARSAPHPVVSDRGRTSGA